MRRYVMVSAMGAGRPEALVGGDAALLPGQARRRRARWRQRPRLHDRAPRAADQRAGHRAGRVAPRLGARRGHARGRRRGPARDARGRERPSAGHSSCSAATCRSTRPSGGLPIDTTSPRARAVLDRVRSIAPGRVTTYADLQPRGAPLRGRGAARPRRPGRALAARRASRRLAGQGRGASASCSRRRACRSRASADVDAAAMPRPVGARANFTGVRGASRHHTSSGRSSRHKAPGARPSWACCRAPGGALHALAAEHDQVGPRLLGHGRIARRGVSLGPCTSTRCPPARRARRARGRARRPP